MKEFFSNKSLGIIPVIISLVAAVIALIRFMAWAPAHNAMDGLVVATLIVGVILNVLVIVKDEDILMVAITACYSFAVFKHLANQVGSFVDAFQGINMFGDATQVGNIISIGIVMGIGVLFAIIAGFMKRERD